MGKEHYRITKGFIIIFTYRWINWGSSIMLLSKCRELTIEKLNMKSQALLNLLHCTEKSLTVLPSITSLVNLVSLLPYVHVILFTVSDRWNFVFTSLTPYTPVWNVASFLEYLNPNHHSKSSKSFHLLQEVLQLPLFLLK